jgi:hypothetical protein
MKKILAALGVALGLASAPAFAAPLCSGITSINGWQGAGNVCDLGDKRFTLIDTDLDLIPPTSDRAINFTRSASTYAFSASEGSGTFIGNDNPLNNNEYIEYSVQVLDPTYVISGIRLDSDISGVDGSAGTTTVRKRIYAGYDPISGLTGLIDDLLSTDGSPVSSIPLSHSILYIRDDLALAVDDIFNSFSNQFTQRQVPEPGLLSLFGVMLAVGGFFSMRRR